MIIPEQKWEKKKSISSLCIYAAYLYIYLNSISFGCSGVHHFRFSPILFSVTRFDAFAFGKNKCKYLYPSTVYDDIFLKKKATKRFRSVFTLHDLVFVLRRIATKAMDSCSFTLSRLRLEIEEEHENGLISDIRFVDSLPVTTDSSENNDNAFFSSLLCTRPGMTITECIILWQNGSLDV